MNYKNIFIYLWRDTLWIYEDKYIFLFVDKLKDYKICLSLAHGIHPTLPMNPFHTQYTVSFSAVITMSKSNLFFKTCTTIAMFSNHKNNQIFKIHIQNEIGLSNLTSICIFIQKYICIYIYLYILYVYTILFSWKYITVVCKTPNFPNFLLSSKKIENINTIFYTCFI